MNKEQTTLNKQEKYKPKQPKAWRKLESSTFIKFDNVGDSIEGMLTDKDTSTAYKFGLYTMKTFKGETKRFHGTQQLDDLLLDIKAPAYLRVTLIGFQPVKMGDMKIFEVEIGEN